MGEREHVGYGPSCSADSDGYHDVLSSSPSRGAKNLIQEVLDPGESNQKVEA